MKSLIKNVMANAIITLSKRTPKTKKETKSVSIRDVSPLNIVEFMKDNDIPDDAEFDGRDNGYDAWDDILLSWDIDVPTTEKDKLEYNRRVFSTIVYKPVLDVLTKNGYKKAGAWSSLYKEFDDTTVYDMCVAEDYDRLVKYYSLSFKTK